MCHTSHPDSLCPFGTLHHPDDLRHILVGQGIVTPEEAERLITFMEPRGVAGIPDLKKQAEVRLVLLTAHEDRLRAAYGLMRRLEVSFHEHNLLIRWLARGELGVAKAKDVVAAINELAAENGLTFQAELKLIRRARPRELRRVFLDYFRFEGLPDNTFLEMLRIYVRRVPCEQTIGSFAVMVRQYRDISEDALVVTEPVHAQDTGFALVA